MNFSIEGIKDTITELNNAIEANDTEKLYELLSLADRLYGDEIPAIDKSVEEAKQYKGTLSRNARIVISVLKEYAESHAIICFSQVECDDEELVKLIQASIALYNENKLSLATEKIWDAFERLKTYYSPRLDKAKSASKIIDDMSAFEPHYKDLYKAEYKALTDIGNGFRIRHHETDKTDIKDERQYDYFFKRCLSLVLMSMQYLEGGKANDK